MDRLISQQAALNLFPDDNLYWDTNEGYLAPHYVRRLLMTLPSTEPEAISKWKKEFREYVDSLDIARDDWKSIIEYIDELPSIQPERKTGHWILDRSGAYCCDNCMEPCAGYVMMRPRDKYCKMCGSRNEVTE